jgi:hypothetical protein
MLLLVLLVLLLGSNWFFADFLFPLPIAFFHLGQALLQWAMWLVALALLGWFFGNDGP